LGLLNLDVVQRKRELDASVERSERRLGALIAEADAVSKRAESLARRAGGARNVTRAPGPSFLKAQETPARASREFFAELGRLMGQPQAPETPAPSRILLAIDNLEALAPSDALRLIETTQALLGPGAVALIACDPAALAPEAAEAFARSRFDVVFNLAAATADNGMRLAARMIGEGARSGPAPAAAAPTSSLSEPLSTGEMALLTALASTTDGTPGAIRRLHNAYRLARLSEAPRPLIALMIAALMSPNSDYSRSLAAALEIEGERFEEPTGSEELAAAVAAARGAHGGPFTKAEAFAAWRAARRWAPSQA